jgi:hypothetical protein
LANGQKILFDSAVLEAAINGRWKGEELRSRVPISAAVVNALGFLVRL